MHKPLTLKTMENPTYFIRFKSSHETVHDAEREAIYLNERLGISNLIQVGYYMPQPKYKSWVPSWLIRWITK
jgi:hypothetical protein